MPSICGPAACGHSRYCGLLIAVPQRSVAAATTTNTSAIFFIFKPSQVLTMLPIERRRPYHRDRATCRLLLQTASEHHCSVARQSQLLRLVLTGCKRPSAVPAIE